MRHHLSFLGGRKAVGGQIPRSEPDPVDPAVRDRRGACGNVMSWSDGLLPRSRKRWTHRKSLTYNRRAPYFYPDGAADKAANLVG